jgi:hypothetical protein
MCINVSPFLIKVIMSTLIIPDKICSHCGGNNWRVWNIKHKDFISTNYRCVLKDKEAQKKWRENNYEKYRYSIKVSREKNIHKYLEKEKILKRNYYLKNKDFFIKQSAKWQKNNIESYKKSARKCRMRSCVNLEDTYIKLMVCHHDKFIKYSDVTPELIELKRKQLILTRIIRNNES